jgi:hypothetical protein
MLRAGAAQIDITPDDLAGLNAMGPDFIGLHDRTFARAVVIENGTDAVAVVSADVLELGVTVELRARIAAATGIPAGSILLAPTHTHNAPRGGRTPSGGLSRAASAQALAYTDALFEAILDAVVRAQAAMVPTRIGVGTGAVDVNVNRDVLRDDMWRLGQNPDGPSDKTLTVIAVRDTGGRPIATLIGYAVHPTAALGTRMLSADVAGAAALAVSDALGAPTLWLPGSLGDQAVRESLEAARTTGDDLSIDDVFARVDAQGRTIADEALRVAAAIDEWQDAAVLSGREAALGWPSKPGTDLPPDMHQEELDLVALRLTALRIGDIALLGVGGEVTTAAAAEILATTDARHPVLVSMANERLGYLADDDAFALGTFAARGCPIQPGWVPVAADVLARLAGERTTA